ncbi:MAG: carboxypeptidase-like regulatory domain-containing protein [candidate division Zixibacteria bacterium]|nr:carboxypeptidase-like regulatory domain-containing protein [candidate division Zixibacteria bacterium]
MRVFVMVMIVCLMSAGASADFLGIKKAGEYVAFPVHPPLDSTGIPGTPDSIQVVTYADNGATKAYSATGSGYTCTGIDTTSDFGRNLIWFADQIQDIDGAGGNCELAIQVVAWYKKLPTYTFATVQVVTDSLNILASINDSLEHQDDWISKFDPAADSVLAKANVLQVSDDAVAANNLELAWDGSNDHSVTLSLKSINVQNAAGSAIVAASIGANGHGVSLSGYGTGKDINADFIDSINATVASRSSFNPAVDTVKARANLVQISGDQAAADDWETMLDGDGGKTLTLRQLRIIGSGGDDTAVVIVGGRAGVSVQGGSDGDIASNIAGSIGRADSLGLGGVAALWNEPQAGHMLAGSFGWYLDAPVSGVSSPAGNRSYPVTIVAIDLGDGDVIPGSELTIRNLELTALLALGHTDVGGKADFNLDTGRYIVSTTAPGYLFSAFDTISVTGGGGDTIRGHHFDPGTPSAPGLCRVYGFVYDVGGEPVEGVTVEAQLTGGGARHEGVIISPYRVTASSDSTGYFSLDLIPSSSLVPGDTKYLISATYLAGTILKKKIHVPEITSWQMSW